MRLTVRGLVVLVAVPVLYALGEILGFAFFRALAGVALGAVLAALLVAVRRPQVVVHREVYPDRVERGRAAMALLQVRNPGARRHPGFTARDLLGDRYHDVVVRELAPRAATTHRYPLPTHRRGCFTVGPLTLERGDPLGLVRSWLVTGDTAPLWVHPRRHPVGTTKVGWPRHHYDGPGSRDPLSGSTDLRQIREYVMGDEVRYVHWKAVARTGTLMVRDYTDPAEPRFTVVLDSRTATFTPTIFEEAVEVAASLVYAAVSAGHRTRLVTTCGAVDLETNAGITGAREMLDRLASLQLSAGPGIDPEAASGAAVLISGGRSATDRRLLAGLRAAQPDGTVFDLCPTAGPPRGPGGVRLIETTSAAEAIRIWNRAPGQ